MPVPTSDATALTVAAAAPFGSARALFPWTIPTISESRINLAAAIMSPAEASSTGKLSVRSVHRTVAAAVHGGC